MVAVAEPAPPETPSTAPDKLPTDATPELLLSHTPPAVVLLSVEVCPTHIVIAPVSAAGNEFTVITFCVVQPVPNV